MGPIIESQFEGSCDMTQNAPQDASMHETQCDGTAETCVYQRNNVACQLWSDEQVQLLTQAVQKYGTNWQLIQELYFPERRPNCLKCKYNYMRSRRSRAGASKALGHCAPHGIREYQTFLQEQTNMLVRQTKGAQLHIFPEPVYTLRAVKLSNDGQVVKTGSKKQKRRIVSQQSVKLDLMPEPDMQMDYFEDYSFFQ